MRRQVRNAFASFVFNGYEFDSSAIPRITGKKLSGITNPSKGVLLGEWPGFFGGSWHPMREQAFRDARNNMGFVDGHVQFLEMQKNPYHYNNSEYDFAPPG